MKRSPQNAQGAVRLSPHSIASPNAWAKMQRVLGTDRAEQVATDIRNNLVPARTVHEVHVQLFDLTVRALHVPVVIDFREPDRRLTILVFNTLLQGAFERFDIVHVGAAYAAWLKRDREVARRRLIQHGFETIADYADVS